jgi:hypothetical protein
MRPVRGRLLAALAFALSAATVPRFFCGLGEDPLFDGDLNAQRALADGVVRAMRSRPGATLYTSGQSRFDGQSAIAAYQMTLMGLSQVVQRHPELRDRYLPVMREAGARLTDPRTLRYAASVYGHHGVAAMAPGEGHAYLGYINLALGMLRAVDPDTPLAAVHDRLSNALAARLFASPSGMIETYPGETWPPDVAAVGGSLGLHSRLTGVDRTRQMKAWAERFARCAIRTDGFLVQRLATGGCKPVDQPRGSGTAVSAYFLSFADRDLSARLHAALSGSGTRSFLGFGALREYPAGMDGQGDGNSGPVVLGVSVGATGFGLGSAAAHGDRELFRTLYRTTALFGVPHGRGQEESFAVGGALGNALLLAMLTAGPA